MASPSFPDLSLDAWRGTRDTLHLQAQVLGKIRGALAPHEKHWWHVGLRVAAGGLTTGPLLAGDRVVELILSPVDHRLYLISNSGDHREIQLSGQSAASFTGATLATLERLGAVSTIEHVGFAATAPREYDPTSARRFWEVLPLIDAVLKRLKAEHRRESGPVLLWPHGFDLAVLLFTGRQAPGGDPGDEESADEQMNFGFSTGDEAIAEPYFYATAYPAPAGFASAKLPDGAYWHTEGWTGAVLRYQTLRTGGDPLQRLLHFFRTARDSGLRLMR